MRITVTARHMEIPGHAKEYATEKAERLGRFYDHIRKIEVVLDVEKDRRYSAEVIVSATRGQVLVCHTVDQSATAALDQVLDKMERQLTKFKEKLSKKHPRNGVPVKPPRQKERELYAGDNFADLWW